MSPKISSEPVKKEEVRYRVGFLLFFMAPTWLLIAQLFGACAITATRPVQEMANTQAALRAAREVQADVLAPELYRQANEWFFRARQEYKIKNFKYAEEYAIKARKFAEKAEFESLRNGANRVDINPPEPVPVQTSEPLPGPTGTPAEVYEERLKEDQLRAREREKEMDAMKRGAPAAPTPPIIPVAPTPAST